MRLDNATAKAQMAALARDFFGSFRGPHGRRGRPDPMDRGTPYRSLVGLPGGMRGELYATFAAENTFGMELKPAVGGDADELNTVWIHDTAAHPFWAGEVYHQFHLNFFQSPGMPYPASYYEGLWKRQQADGRICETGCPEGPHT